MLYEVITGSPNGSVNENKFFNSFPDNLEENMKYIDKLGSPDTYEHFPTGWAAVRREVCEATWVRGTQSRITSYNVCYTKLLRAHHQC